VTGEDLDARSSNYYVLARQRRDAKSSNKKKRNQSLTLIGKRRSPAPRKGREFRPSERERPVLLPNITKGHRLGQPGSYILGVAFGHPKEGMGEGWQMRVIHLETGGRVKSAIEILPLLLKATNGKGKTYTARELQEKKGRNKGANL